MTGQIDIGWATPPFALREIQEKKIIIVARAREATELRNQTIRVNIANVNSLKTKRDAITRLMQVYHEAIEWSYSNPRAIEYFAEFAKAPPDIAGAAVKEFFPKEALQIGEMRDLDRTLRDAAQYKFTASQLTQQDVAGLFDILVQAAGEVTQSVSANSVRSLVPAKAGTRPIEGHDSCIPACARMSGEGARRHKPCVRILQRRELCPCPALSTISAISSRSPTASSPMRACSTASATSACAIRTSPITICCRARAARSWSSPAISSSSTPSSEVVTPGDILPYGECVIHGEIFRARPDVMAIVHHHSPALLPFCLTDLKLVPINSLGATMGAVVPSWDGHDEFGDTPMVLTTNAEGASLARALGPHSMVLMRRHGVTVVGGSLKEVVFRSIMTHRNAELQLRAHMVGKVTPLSAGEQKLSHELFAGGAAARPRVGILGDAAHQGRRAAAAHQDAGGQGQRRAASRRRRRKPARRNSFVPGGHKCASRPLCMRDPIGTRKTKPAPPRRARCGRPLRPAGGSARGRAG